MVETLVINERLWVEASRENRKGDRNFFVLNGAWHGVFNQTKKTIYAKAYPEDVFELISVREAIKGECPPYF